MSTQSSRYSAFLIVTTIGFHILSLQILIADLLIAAAPPEELDAPHLLAVRVILTNFAAIHTTYAYFRTEAPILSLTMTIEPAPLLSPMRSLRSLVCPGVTSRKFERKLLLR